MRAVEKMPWVERRGSVHDRMCAGVVRAAETIVGTLSRGKYTKTGRVAVEAECGTGFCDVLIESQDRTVAWFVEIKTDDEKASAGDIIRQLKWYAAQRHGYEKKRLVCVAESADEIMRELLEAGGVCLLTWSELSAAHQHHDQKGDAVGGSPATA